MFLLHAGMYFNPVRMSRLLFFAMGHAVGLYLGIISGLLFGFKYVANIILIIVILDIFKK
ncbi:hypothetical protein DM784_04125 [Vibrio furnissii]|nr:hypothetical protein DM784_04125 [Vibrio furnissii]